jgi:hypothetical protein
MTNMFESLEDRALFSVSLTVDAPLTTPTAPAQPTTFIGSQSTGAGAGKVTFNPFSITRKIDKATPILF